MNEVELTMANLVDGEFLRLPQVPMLIKCFLFHKKAMHCYLYDYFA